MKYNLYLVDLKGGGGSELEIARVANNAVEGVIDRKGGGSGFAKNLPESNRLIRLPILPFGRFSALNVRLGHSLLTETSSNGAMPKSAIPQ